MPDSKTYASAISIKTTDRSEVQQESKQRAPRQMREPEENSNSYRGKPQMHQHQRHAHTNKNVGMHTSGLLRKPNHIDWVDYLKRRVTNTVARTDYKCNNYAVPYPHRVSGVTWGVSRVEQHWANVASKEFESFLTYHIEPKCTNIFDPPAPISWMSNKNSNVYTLQQILSYKTAMALDNQIDHRPLIELSHPKQFGFDDRSRKNSINKVQSNSWNRGNVVNSQKVGVMESISRQGRHQQEFTKRPGGRYRNYEEGMTEEDLGLVISTGPRKRLFGNSSKLDPAREQARRDFTSSLNKLSVDTFERMSDKIIEALRNIKHVDDLKFIVNKAYEKITSEMHHYGALYSDIVDIMVEYSPMFVKQGNDDKKEEEVDVRHLIVDQIESVFMKPLVKFFNDENDEAAASAAVQRKQYENNIKLFAELHKRDCIPHKVLINIIRSELIADKVWTALDDEVEDNTNVDSFRLSCFVTLFEQMGSHLESPKIQRNLDGWFSHLQGLVEKLPTLTGFAKTRVWQLLELRKSDWVRTYIGTTVMPKSLQEVHEEAKQKVGAEPIANTVVQGERINYCYQPYLDNKLSADKNKKDRRKRCEERGMVYKVEVPTDPPATEEEPKE